jgi:hypothetical protein
MTLITGPRPAAASWWTATCSADPRQLSHPAGMPVLGVRLSEELSRRPVAPSPPRHDTHRLIIDDAVGSPQRGVSRTRHCAIADELEAPPPTSTSVPVLSWQARVQPLPVATSGRRAPRRSSATLVMRIP